MAEEPRVVAWASDALLRELLEQAGWTVGIVATREGRMVNRQTMRDLFLSLQEKGREPAC